MRKLFNIYVSLIVLASIMSSCDWLKSKSDHNPDIYASYFYVNPVFEGDSIISAKDTLHLFHTEQENTYRLDSLAIGDTVLFAATYYTYEQDLISVIIDWDSTLMDLNVDVNAEIAQLLTSKSNVAGGQLYFNPGFNSVTFPCNFSAKAQGLLPLTLMVASTSQFSPTKVYFTIPVKR